MHSNVGSGHFFGYEDFVDIILGLSRNWIIFRGHFFFFFFFGGGGGG